MAILVTGVGYIGAQLVGSLLADGEEVVAIDNLFSTYPSVISRFSRDRRFRFVKGNVCRASVLQQAFEAYPHIDVVYSLAAQASAHPEAATPQYTENTNLLAPRLLLEAMAHYGARTLVFASSFRVYGDDLPPAITEGQPYGRFGDLSHLSKCYAEKLMEMYSYRQQLRCIAVRLGVTYGVSPVMKTDYRFMTAPNKFSLQAVRGEKITVFGSGSNPTGFIHVADAARALRTVARLEAPGGYLAVNAVSEMMPVAALAQIVADEGRSKGFEVAVTLEVGGGTAKGAPKIESKLDAVGFRPERCLRDGVAEMIDHFSAIA